MTHRPTRKRRRAGFTLLELLVVIGVILILIGMLVPVIRKVQSASRQAETQQQISTITNAITRYHGDHAAYPGLFSNTQLGNSAPATYAFNGQALNGVAPMGSGITSSENLVLSVLGGINIAATTPFAPTFTMANVGGGAYNLNTAARKRFPPYLDAQSVDTSIAVRNPKEPSLPAGQWNTAGTVDDSIVPEFVDHFPDPMPILYLRARVGAAGVVEADNTAQYNVTHLAAYGFPTNLAPDFPADATNDAAGYAGSYNYFRNPSLATQPRQKDGFWLISAGVDRKYGTRDDICNFGVIGK